MVVGQTGCGYQLVCCAFGHSLAAFRKMAQYVHARRRRWLFHCVRTASGCFFLGTHRGGGQADRWHLEAISRNQDFLGREWLQRDGWRRASQCSHLFCGVERLERTPGQGTCCPSGGGPIQQAGIRCDTRSASVRHHSSGDTRHG